MFLPNPGVLAAGAGGPVNWQHMIAYSEGLNRDDTVVIPAGVFSICGVCIGAGEDILEGTPLTRGGRGGALRYVNDIPVTPGEIVRFRFSTGSDCKLTRNNGAILVQASYGAQPTPFGVGTGFNGGVSGTSSTQSRPGGGAGGYTSAGTSSNTNIFRGGQGSDPYGRRLTGGGVRPETFQANGENYGGGAGKEFGSTNNAFAGWACIRVIAGPGRAFPNTLTEDMS